MFLFAVIELALGTQFIVGLISVYFTVTWYSYIYFGW